MAERPVEPMARHSLELPQFRGHLPIKRKDVSMSRTTYTPEYRAHDVALARGRRSVESLVRAVVAEP